MRKIYEHNPIGKEELDAGKKVINLVIFLVYAQNLSKFYGGKKVLKLKKI